MPDQAPRPDVVAWMAQHLSGCETCRVFDSSLEESRDALKNASMNPIVPPLFASILMTRISKDRLRRQLEAWRPTLVGAVSAAVLLGSVVQLLTNSPLNAQSEFGGSAWDVQNGGGETPVFRTPPDSHEYDSPTRVDA